MTNKKYDYPEFRIFGSRDGKIVTNFKVLKHKREKVVKGIKMVMDFTKQGFSKNENGYPQKSTIMLEKDELLELLSVLYKYNHKTFFKRGTKTLSIRYQKDSDDFFMQYNASGKNYYCKISKVNAVNLATLAGMAIKREYKRLNIITNMVAIKENIKAIYSKSGINKAKNSNKKIKKQKPSNAKQNNKKDKGDGWEKQECADCGYDLGGEKGKKVRDFCSHEKAKKRFDNKLLCPNCQKKY